LLRQVELAEVEEFVEGATLSFLACVTKEAI
jgi:hypothetical protein